MTALLLAWMEKPVDLDAYLQRIGFIGQPETDLDTLKQMHCQHLLSIPYENLDVQLQRPVDLDIQRIYTKIVEQARGGWCYEMNGLLEWALKEAGFEVMRMTGGVRRAERGDAAFGNHLVLCVQLDEPWIADVGFGDGAFEPVPLRPHRFEQRGFSYSLERLGDCWRLHNHAGGAADSYDFRHGPADESAWLSRSEDSPFVQSLTCQRFAAHGYDIQLGRVAKQVTPGGKREWLIDSPQELLDSLRARFGLDVPEVAGLWERITARHEELFGQQGG
jgi:N-hydroxyarylamine O-acetyltransferase